MRLVSWNVHRCIGTDRLYRPERVAEALASLNADVIGLQEVDSSLKTENGVDQLTYLGRVLGMQTVMGPTLAGDYGSYGNALLVKHPVVYCEEHDLSFRRFEPRGALAIGVQCNGVLIRIVNTHLGLKYWERAFQIRRVLSDLVWREEPLTILMGDFNEWLPFSGNAIRLDRSLGQPPRMATFHSLWPRLALDRIYFSTDVSSLEYEVLRTVLTRIASDHLPLMARFELNSIFTTGGFS